MPSHYTTTVNAEQRAYYNSEPRPSRTQPTQIPRRSYVAPNTNRAPRAVSLDEEAPPHLQPHWDANKRSSAPNTYYDDDPTGEYIPDYLQEEAEEAEEAALEDPQTALNRDFYLHTKIITEALHHFLCEKNKKYGNSALQPLPVFSQLSTEDRIYVRMDDKISRIANRPRGAPLAKNDVADLIGYLLLECKRRDWYDFKDLLD